MKITLLFILSFLFTACSQTTKPPTKPAKEKATNLHLHKLEALNLSEDATEISTGEDEILLFIHLVDKEKSILKNKRFSHVFDTIGMEMNLNLNIDLQAIESIYFTLIELDKEGSEKYVTTTVDQFIQEGILNENKLDSLLGHDDLLGVQQLGVEKLYKKGRYSIDFEGLQLFDKYHYRLWVE